MAERTIELTVSPIRDEAVDDEGLDVAEQELASLHRAIEERREVFGRQRSGHIEGVGVLERERVVFEFLVVRDVEVR
jgi:hypothetical protein